MKIYKSYDNKEVVFEEDAEAYALESLGIKITPKGKGGTLTQEQIDFIGEFVDWFYSGNWFIEEEDEEDDDNEWENDLIERHREYREMQGF